MRSALLILGAILVLGGIAFWVVPSFTTEHTKDVAKLGDLSVQAQEHETHFVPPAVALGAIGLGAILLIAGFRSTRS